jgi:hypothetical protein
MPIRIGRNTLIANHLVLTGYGSWLSNDPRGSGSVEVRKPELWALGPAHFGRKAIQPPRAELRAFHRAAEPLLDHDVAWFDAAARHVIAAAAERVVRERGYTCYAYCNCSNHTHMLNRAHRDEGTAMWQIMADATRAALVAAGLFPTDHPVWASRPYVVRKTDVPAVERCVPYVEDNPEKEGLPRQTYQWVTQYDGWPSHRK